MSFTHLDAAGRPHMVDVSSKSPTIREAVAEAWVHFNPETFAALYAQERAGDRPGFAKGDILATAQIAGVMAAKKTSELIPMCHPLPIRAVALSFTFMDNKFAIRVEATVKTEGPTGVEMEALTAASVAALTLYDMCKAVQKDICIEGIRLLKKTGGKSGDWSSPCRPPKNKRLNKKGSIQSG